MILFGSSFNFQELLVIRVAVLVNFGMKNQVTKVSFKIAASDLMSVFSHEFDDIIFCECLDILEEISGFISDPFTLFSLELPANSYMIACTNIQNFVEKGEDCTSTISVGHLEPVFHTLVSDMKLFGSEIILFFSGFKFQEISLILVYVLINFGVKNQVPQVSKWLLGI